MAIYQNVDGSWTQCQRPYVNRGGVFVPAVAVWSKQSGVWKLAYEYDVLPPNPPELDLAIAEQHDAGKLTMRYIKVGVRLPGSQNDPDARLVRVLTNYNGEAPTTQYGGTFTSATDSDWPNEPWSEWRYNSYGDHKDTSVTVYKQWPRNYGPGQIIPANKKYYFKAWALDNSGNWSAGVQSEVFIPPVSDLPSQISKEARFQPNTSGSWGSLGYYTGDLIQQKSPRRVGLWFYGYQISDSVGASTSSITVKSAQLLVHRTNDNGSANANVYLFWSSYPGPADLPSPGSQVTKHDITKLGTIAKGQSKWFNIPSTYYSHLNNDVHTLGLDWKDPVKADAFPEDYSVMTSVATDLRSGELHVVWTETL